ncbi:hypothetical protein [Fructobacillus ficulneus]|uniref:Uncharacterized protein n=1 Tax=Fructobacillus ficulneus TaxID=157463 RepID=A0A0K8MJY9_9LACO|nr:hypothetical protein [Fructobacillus ficulneus]GAP00195.1 hypothetical protein FFIC_282050 [Fructobacillus ficulneus]
MAVTRGFYQPVTDGSRIYWILWFSALLMSPIRACELFYNIDFSWGAYTVLILAIGILTHYRRQMELSGSVLTMTFVGRKKAQTLDLAGEGVQFSVNKRKLTVDQAGQVRVYHLSKKIAQAVKGLA